MRLPRPIALVLLSTLALCSTAGAKPKYPDWLRQAAEQPAPPRRADEKPTFEVLWDEAHYEILENGRVKQTIRYAIRILDLQERWRAKANCSYYSSSATRPKISAWTLHPNGDVHKYKKSDEKERSNSSYLTLESEVRTVTVDGWDETRTGDVFAYEYTTTESTIFTQYYWGFQSSGPVALSRITVSAPAGWTIDQTYFDASPQKTRDGNTVTWEQKNILSKKWEPHSPSSAAKREHMRIVVAPPPDSRLRFSSLNFETWADLAAFQAKVSDPMAEPTAEIAAKAQALTQGAASEWEKIQALGEYAKAINYEHVGLELGNGGGYTPRPASETFRVGWGDCKDKSTLLRALLSAVGIDSYVVSLNATDNDYADATLPGPFYFNHCITAVQVSDDIQAPAVYEDESLGRLLFIDPTWNNSPIGEIPFEAQGGLAVVGKLSPQPLVRLPLTTPEQNKISRNIVAELFDNASMLGRVATTRHGQSAVAERRLLSRLDRKEYLESVAERYASSGNPSPVVKVMEEKDNLLGDRSYQTTTDFAFPGYAKQMRNVLMIFKPALLDRIVDNPFSETERTLPVRLRARMLEETAKIYTPLGYVADEFVPEVSIQTDFGSYKTTTQFDENDSQIIYTRSFVQNDCVVPLDRYAELSEFFAAIVEAEQTPVVLARK
ncbi:DUF3857 domain-containing transglutaminase family protein [Pelagicoccus sp. SDUM812005]|uniref:DUF3857 domain-containing transglutaminase family protein n=1 Tax=Pelagicoccus sp. SDUM812005 TaxID=3041257 RepID=UPI002810541B|nr:DUF3857 domain-containing transglutaminase family protein [Pelagicoccus sp. SDUM812005]MDQ8183421.1 DUF3857 domain-containing transglutaminase family protein [Pelagicoccus sp. SDUM812005]